MTYAASNAVTQALMIIACGGVTLASCEELTIRHVYADEGLLNWPVLRVVRHRAALPWAQDLLDELFNVTTFTSFLVLKLATAILLVATTTVAPGAHLVLGLLAVAMLIEQLLMKRRSIYGLDGADQMYVVLFLGLAICMLLPHGSVGATAGILYIGLQATLAYAISGIAKLAGPAWRDGSAIPGIMTTKIYGHQQMAALLRGRPLVGRLACWAVIAFELTFVAALFVDRPLMWGILGLGLLFHASTAILMGLNSFFFAFAATYPAIAYANDLISHAVRS